ncbi:hypothetical protein SLEP1_g31336 [Rubroshorea leprosula]|uniref:Uncharacterized protein n=1 Tax=Rubroshorea leprosula TaxID=152421 RepID=A0AAV5K917_9ROSI|nr:hypothetical protein SLEP1_g31336 [Rubroshorea leprosula]
MYLTSSDRIEAAKLYGPSALSEAIPKKPRKKLRTSTNEVSGVGAGKELVPSTSIGVQEVGPRLELKRKGSEKLGALQKKKKVMEQEVGGNEVLEFVPWPPPIELDPKLKETEVEGVEVRAPSKGKGLVPPLSFQSSLFDTKNTTGARRFINATFPEVDKRQAKEEVLRYAGATVVKHALELQKEKDELEKRNNEMQEALDEVVPVVKQLEEEKESLSTKLEGVEENGESMSADFRPQIKLRWDHNEKGRIIFPLNFDFEFVVVEEEEAEVEGAEVKESQSPLQVKVYPVPSKEEQPPLPADQEPPQPPPPIK